MSRQHQSIFSRHRFKWLGGALMLVYLFLCPCCMTMRSSPKQTRDFFNTAGISYTDTTLVIDQIPLHYIQTGQRENPTLFFVHGSPGSWDAFKDYLKDPLLLQKFRMVAIDRPGFGQSHFREAENLGTQSYLLEALIKKIANGQAIYLIGHSLGGPLIVKMATEKPRDYKGLVVLAGALDPKAEKPEKWRYLFKSKPGRYLVPGALQPSNDELYWLKQDLVQLEPKLGKVSCPVLIIHGTQDNLVPYSNVAFMKKKFTRALTLEVVSIPGANHFIPWEHYGLIRDKLLQLQ